MHRLMAHGLLLLRFVVAGILCGAVWAAESLPLADPSRGEPAAADPQREPGPDESGQSDDGAESAGESDADDSQVPPEKEAESVGERLAAGMVELLQREVYEGLKRRNIYTNFARFKTYAAGVLNNTARSTRSELTGNCRLQWYDHMLRNPLDAPAEAEAFTRQLHEAVLGDHRGLDRTLAIAAARLDLNPRQLRDFPEVTAPEQALEVVRRGLTDAQLAYSAALAPLTKSEIADLTQNLYPVLTAQCRTGHTLQSRGTGRRLCDLMEKKIDRNAMHAAADALVPITDPQLLEQLRSLPDDGAATVEGVTGTAVRRIDTPGGGIVIGGKGKNVYQLDELSGVNVVIDLGGDDVYYEGTVSLRRPVLIVIDLDGNDAYEAKKPGVQGAASMGVSMLLDFAGDDVYRAKDLAQGACVAGVGILIDYAGNDAYVALRRAQGQAIGGVGLLIDRAGNDRYHAALWAQGMGGPLGFGMLDDIDGEDYYYGGGLYLNSYLDDEAPTPGYEGWCQGVGGGLRAVSNGGIGVILDGGGDDVYEYDYLSHGGGYWCGVGFARDFGGNDNRVGATRKAYNGGPRTQQRFVRFSSGFGCHYALGFLFDDRGDDTYNGTIMSVGFAWDCAVGYLFDFGGNDKYSGNEGYGAQAGLGVLFDYDGDDEYLGSRQGSASSNIWYHTLPQCGGNFSFVVDYGGTDKYGCRAKNNSYIMRSSSGGFLIDRPRKEEAERTADKVKAKEMAGS